MSNHLPLLLGDTPLRVLDVGARDALLPHFLPVAGHTEIIGFEPDESETARLNAALRQSPWRRAQVYPYALGETQRGRPFYITHSSQTSSLLRPNSRDFSQAIWGVEREIRIDTVSLDDLVAQGTLTGAFDFIKVDTQGSELEILRSGERQVLPSVLGIETEAEFVEVYHDQPRFSEIELYLREQGFLPVSFGLRDRIAPDHGLPAARLRTMDADVIFMRTHDWFADQPAGEREPLVRHAVVLYLLYGMGSEALDLAGKFAPALAPLIRQSELSLNENNPGWRWQVLRAALACILLPTRERRLRLSRLAATVAAPDGRMWRLR